MASRYREAAATTSNPVSAILGPAFERTLTDRDIDDIVAFLESLSSESLKAEVRLSAR